jgi:hypothetical protein
VEVLPGPPSPHTPSLALFAVATWFGFVLIGWGMNVRHES